MNRRQILAGIGIAFSTSFAGCTSDTDTPERNDNETHTQDDNESQSDTSTSDQSSDSDMTLASIAKVEVYIATYLPEEVTIIDADDENLTENKHLADVLSEASEEYENGLEDEFEEEDHLSGDARLAEKDITRDEFNVIEDLLDRQRWDSGQTWYVKYEGVTYVVRTRTAPE